MCSPSRRHAISRPVLLLVAGVLLVSVASPAGERLPYVMRTEFRYPWGENVEPIIGDFDGDGLDEVASVHDDTGLILFLRLVGGSVGTLGRFDADVTGDVWSRWSALGALDLDGDGSEELVIEYVSNDTLFLIGVAPRRGVVVRAAVAEGTGRGHQRYWDGKVHTIVPMGLPDGREGLLVSVAAMYDAMPRELVLMTPGLESVVWRYDGGGAMMRSLAVLDMDGDGLDEVAFGSSAPGNYPNASHLPDDRSYVGLLDDDGRELWVTPAGGDQSDIIVVAADLNGDGLPEVVGRISPNENAVPQTSLLSVWDPRSGALLAQIEIPERAGGLLVEDNDGTSRSVIVGNSAGLITRWSLGGGGLKRLDAFEAGVRLRLEMLTELEGIDAPVIAGVTDRGSVRIYSETLEPLCEYTPPRPTPTWGSTVVGPYRRSDGTTPLMAVAGELLLFAAEPTGVATAMIAMVAVGIVALAIGGALGFSPSLRRRAAAAGVSLLSPLMPWVGLEQSRARLELMARLETGGHDKMIVTRPLRRLADVLDAARADGSDQGVISGLAERSLENYRTMGKPGLERVLLAAQAWSGASRLADRLRRCISSVDAAVAAIESPERRRGSSDVVDALRSRTDELDDVLRELRETAGEAFAAEPAAVITDVLDMLSRDIEAASVTIVADLEDIQGEWAWATPSDLQFLASNMVSNAIRAMRGSPERRISISGEISGSFLILRFEDTGHGIDPDRVDRIFDYGETSKGGEGGAGLFRSRSAIAPLGGSLEVETTSGAGTTFRVKLRRKQTGRP
jgi:signal transduction histidine kinase